MIMVNHFKEGSSRTGMGGLQNGRGAKESFNQTKKGGRVFSAKLKGAQKVLR